VKHKGIGYDMSESIIGEITTEGDVSVVSFAKSSISNTEDIVATSEQLGKFIEQNRPRRIVFDFDGVKFFSSHVLGLLLAVRAMLEKHNGEVVISSINPQLHRVFKITNLDQVFKFFPDKERAAQPTESG